MQARTCLYLLSLLLSTTVLIAQKVDAKGNPVVIHAQDEPHHELLLEKSMVRIYRFELGPQKETEAFQYASDFLEINLNDSEIKIRNAELLIPLSEEHHKGNIRFEHGPRYRQVRNSGTMTTHRAIMMEIKKQSHYGTFGCDPLEYGCVQDYTAPPLPLEPHKSYALALDRDTVRVTDVQIIPGESWKSTVSLEDFVVVPVSDVQLLETSMTDDARQFKKNSGEVAWAPEAFLQGTIKNDGDTPAQFVVVEFKK